MFTELVAIIKKEFRQTRRDRRMMVLLTVAPVIQLCVFGYAVDFDVERVPTVVVDRDDSPTSREHVRRLLSGPTLERLQLLRDPALAEAALVAGKAQVAVILLEGYERDLLRHGRGRVQLLVNGTDPNQSNVAAAAVNRFFSDAASVPSSTRGREGYRRGVSAEPRVLFNPTLATPQYMVPGVLAILLFLITTLVSAMGLARERETGTFEQVLVTPVAPASVVLGKIIPFGLLGLAYFAVAIPVGAVLFDVPLAGNPLVLVGATVLYLCSTLSAGLLVANFSRTQQQAFMGGFFLMLPAVLISGIMTPIRSMPEWLQLCTWLNPLRHYAEVLRASLLKDATAADLWLPLLALGALAAAGLATSVLTFRRSLA